MSKGNIAVVAEEAAYLPSRMTVVYVEALQEVILMLSTDRTTISLLRPKLIEIIC